MAQMVPATAVAETNLVRGRLNILDLSIFWWKFVASP